MAITFTGAGSWGVRVGHQGGWLNLVNTERASTWKTEANNIEADFLTFPDATVISQLASSFASGKSSLNSLATFLQGLTSNTTIQMVYDDTFIGSLTLTTALQEIIRQMGVQGKTVQIPTISVANGVTLSGVTNVGNGVLSASKLEPYRSLQQDYIYAESVRGVITGDSYNSATVNREPMTLTGQTAITNMLSELWPGGSGCTKGLNAIDATQNQSSTGNNLNNSCPTTFTVANTADNWVLNVGTAGGTIANGGAGYYSGTNSVEYLGNGAELTSMVQQFNSGSGTTYILKPDTVYAVNIWTKVLSSAPAAGVLQVSLVDGTGATPTILVDAAGNNNAFTVDLTLETTSYASHTGFFRTKSSIPATSAIRVRLSTAVTNAKNIEWSGLSMTPATQLYPGGPYVALFPGSTPWVIGDTLVMVAANAYDSAWQKLAQQVWNMNSLGLQLPSGAGPNISDALIT